jgi:hypothetical protein
MFLLQLLSGDGHKPAGYDGRVLFEIIASGSVHNSDRSRREGGQWKIRRREQGGEMREEGEINVGKEDNEDKI